MPDQTDFDLRTPDAPHEPTEPSPPNRPPWAAVAIGLLVFAVGLAMYFALGRETSAPVSDVAAAPPVADPAQPGVTPLGADAEPVDVPPLDESDPLVRQLVGKLSSHPRLAAWLATDGLIRNFTVVVSNIAEGRTPAIHLKRLQPSGSFRVVEQNDDLLIDSRSYERYDLIGDAAESIDSAGAARLYATLKPRIEEAHRDLGYPDASFDQTIERAILSLLNTPVVDGPIDVEPRGIVYGYADPKLESLTPAQKQLLRMGPRSVRAIQAKLREIALALGIPAERLPAPRY